MKPPKKKKIRVYLRPEDAKDSDWSSPKGCMAYKAIMRHFKTDSVTMFISYCWINGDTWKVKDLFTSEDHDYVKEQYARDPQMKKAQYYITLIEV